MKEQAVAVKEVLSNTRLHQKDPLKFTCCGERRKYPPLSSQYSEKDLIEEGVILPKLEPVDKDLFKHTSNEKKLIKEMKKNATFKNELYWSDKETPKKDVKLILHVKTTNKVKNFKSTFTFKCKEDEVNYIIMELTKKGSKITNKIIKNA